MKIKQLMVLALVASILFSCKKSEVSNSDTPTLNAAKTSSIKKGEPVVFKLNAAAGPVSWRVAPQDNVLINNSGNSAAITFTSAGNYIVSAQSGSITSTVQVVVDTATYKGGSYSVDPVEAATIAPLTGDQIKITPLLLDSVNKSGIVFTLVTTNKYNCLNNFLSTTFDLVDADDNISINGVYEPASANCVSGTKQSGGSVVIYPIADGKYNLNIKLNGSTYSGSYTKTGKSVKFTWNYSSGVTISPLTIN